MPRLLQRIQAQNESWMVKLAGPRFRGAVFSLRPEQTPTTNFIMPRLAMRTRLREPVKARDLFRDPHGRVLLVGDQDATLHEGHPISQIYVLFQMTEQVSWKRRGETIHPVTKQKVGSGEPIEMGPIWVAFEAEGRATSDGGSNVPIFPKRIITDAMLQLNDVIAGHTVKSVNEQRGVTVAEVQ